MKVGIYNNWKPFANGIRLIWRLVCGVGIGMVLVGWTSPVVKKASLVVWKVDSLTRVDRNAPPEKSNQVYQIYAARGEVESIQVIIRAENSPLTNVRFEIKDLVGVDKKISKTNIALFREHYIKVQNTSYHMGNQVRPLPPGWYPDALIPFIDPATQKPPQSADFRAIPFDLAANNNQPIWVDISVPRNALPGMYKAEYQITSDQGKCRGTLVLHVWDFELPRKMHFKTSFQYWPLVNKYADEELLRNKLMPLVVDPANEAEFMERWGLQCTSLGLWSKANHQSSIMMPEPKVPELAKMTAEHQRGLMLYNHTADEIDDKFLFFNTLKGWARNLHRVGVKNLVTMKPTPELLDDGGGKRRSAVDIWVLLPKMYDEAGDNVAKARKKRNEIWSYNCLVQDTYSPKWLIDYDPINFRIQPGFISQRLGITGLLYWRVNGWGPDPWHSLEYIHKNHFFNGEGVLVYPGEQAGLKGVAPSMRLKWLRDGVEDYEYIQLLEEEEFFKWTENATRPVATNWHNWTRDPNVLRAARWRLGNKLEAIMQKKKMKAQEIAQAKLKAQVKTKAQAKPKTQPKMPVKKTDKQSDEQTAKK